MLVNKGASHRGRASPASPCSAPPPPARVARLRLRASAQLGPAPALQGPPSPPLPGPEALGPAAGAVAPPPRSRKFLALPERAAQVRSLPPFPPSRTIHPLLSSRRLRAPKAVSRSVFVLPTSPFFQFYSIVYYLLGAGARGRERRLEPGDLRRRRPVSARRGLTRKRRSEWRRGARAPGSRACRDNDIICLYASN